MTQFKNKRVWITGASSGIGAALAVSFAKAGAQLILSARNVAQLEAIQKQCEAAGAASATVVRLDISNQNEIFSTAKDVLQKFGKIDILVNNAGISQRSAAKDTKFEVDTHIINVNLLGTIALSKAVLPSMLQHQSGHIVVISSVTGKLGVQNRSAYSASKHGLHGYFDALRNEVYDDNIQITLICPGFVRTNISINAVTADGTPQGTMDETTGAGLDAMDVARRILKAVERNEDEVIIAGFMESFAAWAKRYLPFSIFNKILRRSKTQ
jgi:dehydrogenase/reductase SDR family member 7B